MHTPVIMRYRGKNQKKTIRNYFLILETSKTTRAFFFILYDQRKIAMPIQIFNTCRFLTHIIIILSELSDLTVSDIRECHKIHKQLFFIIC